MDINLNVILSSTWLSALYTSDDFLLGDLKCSAVGVLLQLLM